MTAAPIGMLYGIGVGPGDPDLLTLKAARLLNEVDLIFHPATTRPDGSFAVRIVASLGLAPAKFRAVSLCMARDRQVDRAAYARAAEEIVVALCQGQSVAWIAEGDPLFYSTFSHLRDAVRRRAPEVRIEIVPGITSLQAAAARTGMALASLDETIAIVPAAYGLENLPVLLDRFDTICLLKVHGHVDELLDQLARTRVPAQAFYVERVGTAEERIVTDLQSLRGQQLPYFSLVLLRRAAAGKERA